MSSVVPAAVLTRALSGAPYQRVPTQVEPNKEVPGTIVVRNRDGSKSYMLNEEAYGEGTDLYNLPKRFFEKFRESFSKYTHTTPGQRRARGKRTVQRNQRYRNMKAIQAYLRGRQARDNWRRKQRRKAWRNR